MTSNEFVKDVRGFVNAMRGALVFDKSRHEVSLIGGSAPNAETIGLSIQDFDLRSGEFKDISVLCPVCGCTEEPMLTDVIDGIHMCNCCSWHIIMDPETQRIRKQKFALATHSLPEGERSITEYVLGDGSIWAQLTV